MIAANPEKRFAVGRRIGVVAIPDPKVLVLAGEGVAGRLDRVMLPDFVLGDPPAIVPRPGGQPILIVLPVNDVIAALEHENLEALLGKLLRGPAAGHAR